MNNKIITLQEKLKVALANQKYTEVVKLQNQLKQELNRKEHVPLSTILPQMTPKEVEDALCKMHKVFITADILYGFAMEFEETIQKFDPSMEMHVVKKIREISSISRGITKEVDKLGCSRLSETFGDMCDEVRLLLENVIYKYRQRDKNRNNNQK